MFEKHHRFFSANQDAKTKQLAAWLSFRFIPLVNLFIYLLLRFYLFILRERGRKGEREGEKHPRMVASHMPPTEDQALNPGTCPNWEWNR